MTKKIAKAEAKVSQHPISYEGRVVLKIQKEGFTVKQYEIKNSGTILLFNGIARFLRGDFNNSDFETYSYIPNYLGVGYQENLTATDPLSYKLFNELPVDRILLTKQDIKINPNTNSVELPLAATLLYSEIGARRVSELGLFSTASPGSSSMLARITIPSGYDDSGLPGIELPVGMNLLVEWNIVIQNSAQREV